METRYLTVHERIQHILHLSRVGPVVELIMWCLTLMQFPGSLLINDHIAILTVEQISS